MPTRKPTDTPTDDVDIEHLFAIKSARGWVPNPGDRLIRPMLVAVEMRSSEYGSYPCLILKRGDVPNDTPVSDQYVALHAFHMLVQQHLAEMKPKRGHVFPAIQYNGKIETNASVKADDNNNRRYYQSYTFLTEEDLTSETSEEFDWSTVKK